MEALAEAEVVAGEMRRKKKNKKDDFLFYGLVILLLLFFLIFTFSQDKENKICFKNKCFDVELATTMQEQVRGLMFRQDLEVNKGMLFIFTEEEKHGFWMKNMLSGEGDPPEALSSESDMLSKVAKTPGAIGFVSEKIASSDVKILIIIEDKNNE